MQGNELYNCMNCDKEYKTKSGLVKHIANCIASFKPRKSTDSIQSTISSTSTIQTDSLRAAKYKKMCISLTDDIKVKNNQLSNLHSENVLKQETQTKQIYQLESVNESLNKQVEFKETHINTLNNILLNQTQTIEELSMKLVNADKSLSTSCTDSENKLEYNLREKDTLIEMLQNEVTQLTLATDSLEKHLTYEQESFKSQKHMIQVDKDNEQTRVVSSLQKEHNQEIQKLKEDYERQIIQHEMKYNIKIGEYDQIIKDIHLERESTIFEHEQKCKLELNTLKSSFELINEQHEKDSLLRLTQVENSYLDKIHKLEKQVEEETTKNNQNIYHENELNAKISEYKDELNSKYKVIVDLEDSIFNLNQEYKEFQDKIVIVLKTKEQEYLVRSEKMSERIKNKSQEYEELNQQLVIKIKSIETEKIRFEQEKSYFVQREQVLQRQNDELQQEKLNSVSQTNNNHDRMDFTISKLHTTMQEITNKNSANIDVITSSFTLDKQRLENTNERLIKSIEHLQSKHKELESTLQLLKDESSKTQQLLVNDINILQKEKNEAIDLYTVQVSITKEKSELYNKLLVSFNEQNSGLSELLQCNTQKEVIISTLSNKIEELNKMIASEVLKNERYIMSNQEMSNKIDEYKQTKNDHLDFFKSSLQDQLLMLPIAIEDKNKKIKEMQEHFDTEKKTLNFNITTLQQQLASLEQQFDNSSQQYLELMTKYKFLHSQYDDNVVQNQKLNNTITMYTTSIETLKSTHTQLQNRMDDCNKTIGRNEIRISDQTNFISRSKEDCRLQTLTLNSKLLEIKEYQEKIIEIEKSNLIISVKQTEVVQYKKELDDMIQLLLDKDIKLGAINDKTDELLKSIGKKEQIITTTDGHVKILKEELLNKQKVIIEKDKRLDDYKGIVSDNERKTLTIEKCEQSIVTLRQELQKLMESNVSKKREFQDLSSKMETYKVELQNEMEKRRIAFSAAEEYKLQTDLYKGELEKTITKFEEYKTYYDASLDGISKESEINIKTAQKNALIKIQEFRSSMILLANKNKELESKLNLNI